MIDLERLDEQFTSFLELLKLQITAKTYYFVNGMLSVLFGMTTFYLFKIGSNWFFFFGVLCLLCYYAGVHK